MPASCSGCRTPGSVLYSRRRRGCRLCRRYHAASRLGTCDSNRTHRHHLLATFTVFDLSKTICVSPRLEWAGAIIGGVMFGVGMALVGTCGFGTLLRLGGGDLKALLTFLVIAISSYMAIRGLMGLLRVQLLDPLALNLSPKASQTIGGLLGLSAYGNWMLVAAVALGLLALAFSDQAFRQSRRLITSGELIGALVAAGWWITGVAGQDPFEVSRAESFTFVAPLGETLFYVMLGHRASKSTLPSALFSAFWAEPVAAKLECPDPAK